MELGWGVYKKFLDSDEFSLHYIDTGDQYIIWSNNLGIETVCRITKDGGPDQIDFETNYKNVIPEDAPALDTLREGALVSNQTFTALNQTVNIDVTGLSTVRIQVTGTWVGSLTFNVSTNGTNFDFAPSIWDVNSPSTYTQFISANATLIADVTGCQSFQITTSGGWTSGTAAVCVVGSQQQAIIETIAGVIGVSGSVRIKTTDDAALNIGSQLSAASLPVVIASDQLAIPITGSISASNPSVSATGLAVPADATMVGGSDGTNLKAIKVSSAGVVSVDASGVAIPLAASSAVIGHVINDASSAVIGHVIVDSAPSTAVTNAGTFPVQATLSAETTKVIGTVNVSSGQTIGLVAGSAVIGHVINDASSAVIGHVIVDSGTVTANAGTNLNTSALALDASVTQSQGTVAAGTAATKSTLIGGQFNTSLPTLTNTQQSAVQLDSSGRQIIAPLANTSIVKSQLQDNSGNALNSTSNALNVSVQNASLAVTIAATQAVNHAQTNGATTVTSVTGVQDVMPRKRTSTTGLSPNYSANHISSKTTTSITASTAYLSALVISCSSAGSAWTMVVQNGEATPKILIPSFTLAAPTTGLPIILQFEEPILMTTGISVVTAGTTAGTVDVFCTYWQ